LLPVPAGPGPARGSPAPAAGSPLALGCATAGRGRAGDAGAAARFRPAGFSSMLLSAGRGIIKAVDTQFWAC
jgi:hypothetical protein